MIAYRHATPIDLETIASMEATIFAEQAWSTRSLEATFDERAATFVMVAADDQTLAGYAIASDPNHRDDPADIQRIAVATDYRRRGIASALLTSLLAEISAARTMLEVACDNDAALALYARLGFVAIARRPRYYGGTSDAVVMERVGHA